ncbi:MAG: molybdenum cofactor guanylyltransferase [Clostridiaceae bacterium]
MKEFGTAVILCGGKSTRMGFDKAMIKVGDKFLIEIIAERLEPVFERIILISNDSEKLKNVKYQCVTDIIPDLGPIGAIYTALKNSDSRYVFVTACDMPVINLDFIKHMMNVLAQEGGDGVISKNGSFLEPLYSFYSVDMTGIFEEVINEGKLRLFDVISRSNIHYVEDRKVREYSKNMDVFTNINYQNDLDRLEKFFMEE